MRTLTAPFSNLTNAQRSLRKKISGQRPNTEKKHSGFKAQIKNLRNRLISFLRNKRNNIVVIIMSESPSFPPASAPPLQSDAPLSNSEPSPPLPRSPSSALQVLAPLPLDSRNLPLVAFPRSSGSDEGKFPKLVKAEFREAFRKLVQKAVVTKELINSGLLESLGKDSTPSRGLVPTPLRKFGAHKDSRRKAFMDVLEQILSIYQMWFLLDRDLGGLRLGGLVVKGRHCESFWIWRLLARLKKVARCGI
ncbi:hypothetical protein RUND412_006906 [Rhizina undulata]